MQNLEKTEFLMDLLQRFHFGFLTSTFPNNDADDQLKGVLEELGELARAELKHKQNVGPHNDVAKVKADITDAVGDIIMYLMGYCSIKDIKISDCLDAALTEICTRDWNHFVETGEKRYYKLPSFMQKLFWV
jgi:NTP pyrophosphatase (non-canonical NTP hydrolase)